MTRVLQALYEEAFPPLERSPFETLVEDIRAGTRKLHLALDPAETPVAFGISLDLPPVLMLEYLAVAPNRRSHGVGGELLDAIAGHARALGYGGIVLEVERPDADGADDDQRARRIAFYRRHGAEFVDCAPDYQVPRLDGVVGSVAMSLLWIPAPAQPCPRGPELERTIRDIMAKSYDLPPEDPLFRANLRSLAC